MCRILTSQHLWLEQTWPHIWCHFCTIPRLRLWPCCGSVDKMMDSIISMGVCRNFSRASIIGPACSIDKYIVWLFQARNLDHLLLLGEEASLSIANTLWCISTMFTRLAITPPEVYGFGWNLGYSQYIVYCIFWSWPWQIWARSAQKRERESERKFFLSGK